MRCNYGTTCTELIVRSSQRLGAAHILPLLRRHYELPLSEDAALGRGSTRFHLTPAPLHRERLLPASRYIGFVRQRLRCSGGGTSKETRDDLAQLMECLHCKVHLRSVDLRAIAPVKSDEDGAPTHSPSRLKIRHGIIQQHATSRSLPSHPCHVHCSLEAEAIVFRYVAGSFHHFRRRACHDTFKEVLNAQTPEAPLGMLPCGCCEHPAAMRQGLQHLAQGRVGMNVVI
mmetsp:Transcript_102720/g.219678  ORF Transcript_102720/g.219678 Transcript_102720/m.219678 type:complete len:229 (+) Transcript_102720:26-712(+)